MPLLWTPSHVIYDVTLPGNATNIDVTNLDHNNDGPWQLYLTSYNPQGSTGNIQLFFNGDYTGTNYKYQFFRAYGTSRVAGRGNGANIESLPAGTSSIVFGVIMIDAANYARWKGSNCRKVASDLDLIDYAVCTDNTVANITSLRIASSIANGLGAGTRLILTRIAH